MKQYGVKCGAYMPSEKYSTLGQARLLLKKLKAADESYDIGRNDGYYKIVEREVGPWRVVKEETK